MDLHGASFLHGKFGAVAARVLGGVVLLSGCETPAAGPSDGGLLEGPVDARAVESSDGGLVDGATDGQAVLELDTHVHLFQFEQDPDSNSTFTEGQVMQAFDIVNGIWARAGIRFSVKQVSTVTIPGSILPGQSPTFTQIMGLDPSLIGSRTMCSFVRISQPLEASTWNVGIIRRAPSTMGGGAPGNGSVFFFENKTNAGDERPTDVEVLAHEIGHTLVEGDPANGHHYVGPGCETNLMRDPSCGGGPLSSGHELTAEQVREARAQAAQGPRVYPKYACQ